MDVAVACLEDRSGGRRTGLQAVPMALGPGAGAVRTRGSTSPAQAVSRYSVGGGRPTVSTRSLSWGTCTQSHVGATVQKSTPTFTDRLGPLHGCRHPCPHARPTVPGHRFPGG